MPKKMSGKFLYFAYGSNLWSKRIHINNPTAIRAGIAKLKDYKLDFVTYSKRWKGASATITPKNGSHVWGALWEINDIDLPNLDRQEGVQDNIYIPLTVDVETPEGTILQCRTYKQTAVFDSDPTIDNIPDERKPSAVYLSTILNGAEETCLPEDYMAFLKKIPDNGYTGEVDIGVPLNFK